MAKGWISVHRQIQNHWLWEDKPFSKGQAWIDLLLMANHEDSKFLLGNQIIEAKRGDVITSEVKLAKHWGWSRTKVRTFLELLEADSMIVKKSDSKKTALTVVNYGLWQDMQTAKEQQKDSIRTTLVHQKNTINNVNNYNNSNNNISSYRPNKFADDSTELSIANELFSLILENNSKAKKPNLQSWAIDIDKMIRLDKRSPEEIRALINWSQRDPFWQQNILSARKLREKFDQLTLKMNSNYCEKGERNNDKSGFNGRDPQPKRKPWELISDEDKVFFSRGFED
ncbi:hypothetical protein Desaci_3039 [Desulfosporosinus acidiphilus SJ4]|uniref:Phage protein n=1 Tax=Desulfosporosinus acidiphilus (strain DSM 22704 / JCM 16185 / SJ4) TaxID=646529 RepID=I4D823_DESAJ|nr:hypothetical protein [Desulfosporosinus acidiphilus]AFM41947.1 hypothetical protein Desaci_3039 [Desulfosporosinus acidiphilus SJ4]